MQVLYGAGFDAVESDTANEWSYSFSGLSGSIDHVLANSAAMTW
jgi:5'-nucleotidase